MWDIIQYTTLVEAGRPNLFFRKKEAGPGVSGRGAVVQAHMVEAGGFLFYVLKDIVWDYTSTKYHLSSHHG
jgi:hypothetical protein